MGGEKEGEKDECPRLGKEVEQGFDIGTSWLGEFQDEELEARERIELTNSGFANRCLTTWLSGHQLFDDIP